MLGSKCEELGMKLQNKDAWKRMEKRKVKRCIYQIKKEVNEQFVGK